jgi:CxxC motif-containing protein (DUF1111 family)
MMRHRLPALLALTGCLLGCEAAPSPADPEQALSGGSGSVWRADRNAFSQPSALLSPSRRLAFSVGNSFFRNPWVSAPASTTARDGLGPLFNTNACQNCHVRDGRGQPANGERPGSGMLVRLSIAPEKAEDDARRQRLGVVPEPVYGVQLQDRALPGVPPEARVRLEYQSLPVTFADGLQIELRRPILRLSELGYGPLHPHSQLSVRIAPPMIGLGLLEAIPDAALLAHADPDDADGDGISGRANQVWDLARQHNALGRFGWKAGQPSLDQQNAHALAHDLGLTSSLLARTDCTPQQPRCLDHAEGDPPEVSDRIRASLLFYSRLLAVPARRQIDEPQVRAGQQLFQQAGCQQCHVAEFITAADAAEPELANQRIRPYSDLLLHDMGEGLADGRAEFLASGREWRTPPLWGIGLTEQVSGGRSFLHDGRARTLLEAIAWHGGEAQAAKDRVLHYDAQQRAALLAFLHSL